MSASRETTWFDTARFGLFVHWGLYSVAGRHEWVMERERITASEYERYARYFDPDLFNPHEWMRAAKDAGAGYIVLTAKHHDGFCMWDASSTDFTVMRTPAGRDLLREFVDAARDEGLKVGLYYSLIDWHHPDFPIDGIHPLRDAENVAELNAARSIERYRSYLHGQVRELLTEYGQIDYLFFDYSYDAPAHDGTPIWNGKGPHDWGSDALLDMVRRLQPEILVNDRLGIEGDVLTPEQYQPAGPMIVDGRPALWEACQTINGSWGYDRDNHEDKSAQLIATMLIDGVSKGGNLLLNVGPTARGVIPDNALRILQELREWMRFHKRSVIGADASDLPPTPDVRFTRNGDRIYAHIMNWPFGLLHLPGLGGRVEHAQLLNDGSELSTFVIPPEAKAQYLSPAGMPDGTLSIRLPTVRPDVLVPVIELFLNVR